MMARQITTILPAMTRAEAIETTRIRRVAGLTGDRTALVTPRPCRAPLRIRCSQGGVGPSAPGQVLWRMWGRASPTQPSLDRPTSGLTPSGTAERHPL